ncbi:MAG: riboflavin kinase, partial [Deltaproteobacteria bacterium]|nr:riboflavin kinase [Deltaproteobacteria bacterium]
ISEGKVTAAEKFLGRPFALTGIVEKGHGIGGKLGINTANLKLASDLLPKTGIYITRTEILDGSSKKGWPSATSVGFNPTFPGKGFSVETHLIGFEGDLLGKEIEVAFLEWLRDELTFPNEETLATQIEKDIARTLQYYKDTRN